MSENRHIDLNGVEDSGPTIPDRHLKPPGHYPVWFLVLALPWILICLFAVIIRERWAGFISRISKTRY